MLCVCLPVLASLFCSVLWYVPLASRSSSWFNSRVEVKFMSSERDQSRSWGLPGAAERKRKAKSGNRWTLPWPLTRCRRFEPWKGQTGPSSRNLPTATERDTDTDSDSDSAQAKNTQQGGEAAAQQTSLGAVCRRRAADNIGSDSDSSSYRQFQHPYHPLAFACTIFCTLAPQYTTRDSSKTTAFCLLTLLNSTFRLVSILEISNYH